MAEETTGIDALRWKTAVSRRANRSTRDTLVAGPFMYDEAAQDYQGFWARQALDLVTWAEEWTTICEWELPFAKWFVGGKLNVSYNCLDRHVEAGLGRPCRHSLGGRTG